MRTVLAFDANAKQQDLTEKLKTASGKYRISMVTWSFLYCKVDPSCIPHFRDNLTL